MDDKEKDKHLAKKMINPYSITDRNFEIGLKNNLDSHNVNHTNSISTVIPIYPDFGIETKYNNEIMKEMSTIYARLIN